MNGTESKLWRRMAEMNEALGYPIRSLRRFESPITPGASDVEYVAKKYCGWIELKTCSMPRAERPFTLHCAFTVAQSEWLLSHSMTKCQRSWLMLGVLGPRTWRRFILVDPENAIALIAGRDGIPHEELLIRSAVRAYDRMEDLLRGLDR